MKVTKTIQSGAVNITKKKKKELRAEYENLQKYLHNGEDVELHSANKQQAKRYYDKIKEDKEYPISLRKDLIDLERCSSDVCDYFVKVPIAQRHGGINVPVKTGREIRDSWELCESKLFRKNDNFYLNLTFKIEVNKVDKDEYNGVIGVDLGLRNPIVGAASVAPSSQPKVFVKGQKIKNTQTNYYYLRKQSSTNKGWRNREYNKVRDKLHKLTTKIADYAQQNKLIVCVGDLKGIQDQDRGRAMNRKLSRFPHYSFRQMLEYKLKERGIKYIEVNEAFTSQRCSRCGEMGERYRGVFRCSSCGYELDSDANGARNIMQRALGKPETKAAV